MGNGIGRSQAVCGWALGVAGLRAGRVGRPVGQPVQHRVRGDLREQVVADEGDARVGVDEDRVALAERDEERLVARRDRRGDRLREGEVEGGAGGLPTLRRPIPAFRARPGLSRGKNWE